MQVIFTKGEKILLKGLKIKHFQFILMSVRSLKKKLKKMKKMKKKNKKNKKKKQEEKQQKQKEESEESKFFIYIENKSKDISYILFYYYFNFKHPSELAKKLFEIKDKKKNNDSVEEIKNRWSQLKYEAEKTSKDKKEKEREEKILEIVKDILNFNKQNQQKGQGIKILTQNQMFNRLPIAVAQLQAGNNSEKLKK